MGGGRLALFSRRRKCRRCCPFLLSDVTLVVQVRSSVMCTLRNLVLPTLSTVEPSMVSGGVVRVSPEVHHNLFCLTHIEGQVVCTTPFSQLCHFTTPNLHKRTNNIKAILNHFEEGKRAIQGKDFKCIFKYIIGWC